ncbi:two-component system sensor histidine kinase TctE [Fluviicoccus keumensis]|uniref:histidine kinase n=1 Tax=Fluviicoccus keumensis TaxID=1435465 RepID=A0A4Q7YM44_9GAMM|nr:sensor histidine kinase [Fluviicoccus keumensis]RZU38420.1 two-component system sensor histidine kinase TctE [Fluviicoccus keumensis]
MAEPVVSRRERRLRGKVPRLRRVYSLRGRLLLWMLIPLLLVLSCSGVIAYYQAMYYANSEYDQTLYKHVHSLAQLVERRGNRIVLNMPKQAKRMFLWNAFDTTYYQIRTEKRVIAGEKVFPVPQGRVLKYDDTMIYDGDFKGTPVRAAQLLLDLPELEETVQIKVAQTQFRRQKLTSKILLSVVAPQLALIFIVFLVVSVGVNRSLRPLSAITRALEKQTHQRISPVPDEGVPREVQPLAQAINDLLQRLDEALGAQRRFIANAAHQLRTPLTAIRLNMERQENADSPADRDEAGRHLRTSVERTIRLSRQLLTLARAEPESLRQSALESIDLVALMREEGSEWVPVVLDAGGELSLEAPETPIRILGHAVLLRECVSNLIDNALKYGGPGVRIALQVEAQPQPSFTVLDNGPGIDPEVGDRIFERFFRNDEGGEGAGLGLSIVKEIAQLHGARIVLGPGLEGRGLRVSLVLPLPEAAIVPAGQRAG